MGIKRAAVSKRISELEEILGFRVITRARPGGVIRLTPRGHALHVLTAEFDRGLANLTAGRASSSIPDTDPLMQARLLHAEAARLVEMLTPVRGPLD